MAFKVKPTLHPTLHNIRMTATSFFLASSIAFRVCDVTFIRFRVSNSLFFATSESIDCYIALFGKIRPNSLNAIGRDLFIILLHIRVSIGVSVCLTFFAHQPPSWPLLFAFRRFVTHTCHPNEKNTGGMTNRIASFCFEDGTAMKLSHSTFGLIVYGGTCSLSGVVCRDAVAEGFSRTANQKAWAQVGAFPFTKKCLEGMMGRTSVIQIFASTKTSSSSRTTLRCCS
jgi:hypothetical protein